MPFSITNEGVVTENLEEKIVFHFMKNPIIQDLNLVQVKEKIIYFFFLKKSLSKDLNKTWLV